MGVRVIVSFLGPTTGTRILSNYHLSSRLLRFVPGYDEGEFADGIVAPQSKTKNLFVCNCTIYSSTVTIVNRSSGSIAEYCRQQATSAPLRHCSLKRGSTLFFVRQNKATSRSFVPNSAPLSSPRFPMPTTTHY